MNKIITYIAQLILFFLTLFYFEAVPKAYSQDLKKLQILSVFSNTDTIAQGQKNISVQMRIRNNGRKSASITTTKLIFKNNSSDISDQFYVSEQNNNPTIIKRRSSIVVNYFVSIAENVNSGNITIDGEVEGFETESNKQLADYGADITKNWFILKPLIPQIISIYTSQQTITQYQEKDWYVWLEVQNPGTSAVRLDSGKIYFSNNTDISHEYSIINPTLFWSDDAGSQFLEANNQDTLRFIIDQSGFTPGAAAINGELWITDTTNQQQYLIQNNISVGSILVQTPAILAVDSIFFSQDSLAAGQEQEWNVVLHLKNFGESSVFIDTSITQTNLKFENDGNFIDDFEVIQPAGLDSQPGLFELAGGQNGILVFIIQKTADIFGHCQVLATVGGLEINSDKQLSAGLSGSVFIVRSASVYILSTNNMAFNQPEVNSEQIFEIDAAIFNNSAEIIREVIVALSSDQESSIISPQSVINIAPGSSETASFSIIASENTGSIETFTAMILSAESIYPGQQVLISSPLDSNTFAIIEKPALAQLESNIDDADGLLSAGQIQKVTVILKNRGTSKLIDQGIIELIIPENYLRINAGDTSYVSRESAYISMNEPAVWQIKTPDHSQGPDNLITRWISAPKDENTNFSAKLFSPADSIVITTFKQSGIVSYTEILSPEGAIDRVLSTDQEFVIRTVTNPTPHLTDLEARLILPGNYSTTNTPTQRIENDTVYWTIQSPNFPDQNSKALIVQFSGTDINGLLFDFTPDTLIIITETKAGVSLESEIFEPQTAKNGELFIGQGFTIRARVLNSGQAGLYGTAHLHLDLGSTGITVSEPLTRFFLFENDNNNSNLIYWHATAPMVPKSLSNLRVNILSAPSDENTNKKAFINKDFITIELITIKDAKLTNKFQIAAPEGARDMQLSTDQTFTIHAVVHSINCSDIQALLKLPEGAGFFTENSLKSAIAGVDTVSWTVIAPNLPVQNSKLQILLTAKNAEDNQKIISLQDSMTVAVVEKARLQVSAQTTKSIVSTEEIFTITAQVNKYGDAEILNEAIIQLSLPEGFTTPDDTIKTTSQLLATWLVKAPNQPAVLPKNIRLSMIGRPLDENTNIIANATNLTTTLVILVDEIYLKVIKSPSFGKATVAQGEINVPILGLELLNKGNTGSNGIQLRSIKFNLRGREGELISPQSVLSKIEIRDRMDTDLIYGHISNIPSENPVAITFPEQLVLKPNQLLTSLGIYGDVSPNAGHNSFYLAIESNTHIDAVDAVTQRPVNLVDGAENQINALNITSNISAILGKNVKTTFGNYPNPFGRQDHLTTDFVYYLESDSFGEIKIYTLTGNLVKVYKFSDSDLEGRRGVRDGDISWDGKNGNGHTVLSGVYVAVLTIKGKSLVTKIAYMK